MTTKLILGPILGIESNTIYTVCFLTDDAVNHAGLAVGSNSFNAEKIESIYSGSFWRVEFNIALQQSSTFVDYEILVNGVAAADQNQHTSWRFYVPGQDEKPRMAYASCNGYSDYKLMSSSDDPYALWKNMQDQHERAPFSMLILGGDQVYADSIWSIVPTLKNWNELGRKEKIRRKPSKVMKQQVDRFYSKLYCDRWNKVEVASMLASVPSVMMWDDHDIIDGWGSYPEDLQNCLVYQAIYESAAKYFRLFQLRSIKNESLLSQGGVPSHYSFGFCFRGYNILALDNRAQRSLVQVMAKDQWVDIDNFLSRCQQGDLLVLAAVPVVYRDFSFTEAAVDATPWEEELTDDLKDHWRAKEHQGERAKLIMRLLQNAANRKSRTVILSGDVHIGCLGVIRDSRGSKLVNIHQVVSSAIVHPAPTYIQWLGILAVTNDSTEYLDENREIRIDMLKPYGSNQYLRTRNFVTMQDGTDSKLWVNWICENGEKPTYPLQGG